MKYVFGCLKIYDSERFTEMMSEITYVSNPTLSSNWLVWPVLLMSKGNKSGLQTLLVYEFDNVCLEPGIKTDSEISSIVNRLVRKDIFFDDPCLDVIFDDDVHGTSFVIAACYIIRTLKFTAAKAIQYVETSLNTRDPKYIPKYTTDFFIKNIFEPIHRYKRPLNVIFCGDRNSAVCFEESISFELKSLPKYSVVIHGGCKGVDLYTEELAKLVGIETICYPVHKEQWEELGPAAGPIRNSLMLDKHQIDMVIAFHPDISMSKGTKDMMSQAWKRGIRVFIHDLKRKEEFKGDFGCL